MSTTISKSNTIELQQRYELPLYNKREIVVERGEGCYLWDDAGRRYLDCAAGSGSLNVGHSHPAVVNAIKEQAEKIICCFGIFHNPVRSALLAKLVAIAPSKLTRAFLCNSGTESVEAAIKFARVSTGRPGIVAAVRAFHGRTYGALSATHNPKYREGFEPLVPGFRHVPFNDLAALEQAIDGDTAAVILEPVQGEGGVYPASRDYLQGAARLCASRKVMLILDEIQTGFCRTGTMFACEQFGIEPDILCVAKSIAGGVPMGATLCSDAVKVSLGQHGTTFGGSPLACAAALAAIDVMEREQLADAARDKGAYFAEKLRGIASPKIREVRHLGLMVGVQLKEKSLPYLQGLMREGIIAIPASPTVIRYLPPLTITKGDLDLVVEKTALVLSEAGEPEEG